MQRLDATLTGTTETNVLIIPDHLGDTRVLCGVQGVWAGTVIPLISLDGGATWLPQANLTANWSKSLDLKGGVQVKYSVVLTSGSAKVQLLV